MRRKWAVALAVGAIGTQLLAGAPARSSKLPVLAETTTISATTTSVAHVVLPHPVRVSTFPFHNPLFEIDSSGRVAGAVLKQDVAKGGAEAYGLQFSVCAKAPCSRRPQRITQYYDPKGNFAARHATLPAGRYLLFVVADGVPTTVRLNLPGLGGATTVRPDSAPRYSLESMDPTIPAPSSAPVYEGTAESSIGHMGLTVAALELTSDKDIGDEFNFCTERADSTSPGLPGQCLGSGGDVLITSRGQDGHRALAMTADLTGRGHYRQSISVKSASVVKEINGVSFTLDYGSGHRVGGLSSMSWYSN